VALKPRPKQSKRNESDPHRLEGGCGYSETTGLNGLDDVQPATAMQRGSCRLWLRSSLDSPAKLFSTMIALYTARPSTLLTPRGTRRTMAACLAPGSSGAAFRSGTEAAARRGPGADRSTTSLRRNAASRQCSGVRRIGGTGVCLYFKPKFLGKSTPGLSSSGRHH
jgi:hypothetical protein